MGSQEGEREREGGRERETPTHALPSLGPEGMGRYVRRS